MCTSPCLTKKPIKNFNMFLKVECDGLLISFGFKLCILLAGTWAVFARQPRATLPRIHLYRSLVTSVAAVLTFSFWLFYSVKVRPTFTYTTSTFILSTYDTGWAPGCVRSASWLPLPVGGGRVHAS